MRRLLVLLLLVAWLLPCAAETFTAKVVSVHDGDTLTVETPEHIFKVRLSGIDCPEAKQRWGEQATWFTRNEAMGRTVSVIEHGTDRYGRVLADVVLPDGRSLNQELVRSGRAWWYRKYAPADEQLARIEAIARKERRGLWAEQNPVAPWEW